MNQPQRSLAFVGSLAAAFVATGTGVPSTGYRARQVVTTAIADTEYSVPGTLSGDRLIPQSSGTTALLQAVSVVNDQVVWVSGHDGTYVRTTDGGATWTAARVPGADSLQFRDVEAFSAREAFLMSAGSGELSRVYYTNDAGATWTLQNLNTDPKAFYDCFAFWDQRHGALLSDQVNGRTVMLETTDDGHWVPLATTRVPSPAGTEGGFAASGTCLITMGKNLGWIATGAGDAARVFLTTDRGDQWTAVNTPVKAGPTAGLATIAFRDERHGTAMGGDVGKNDDRTSQNVAITGDGGRTWKLGTRPPFAGGVFGSAYAVGLQDPALIAVGPGGMARSDNDGRSWRQPLDTLAYWAVGFGKHSIGWAVGPKGRITKVDLAP